MGRIIIRKISIWVLSILTFLMLAPLTSYAFSFVNFSFDSDQHKIGSSIYTDDPTNVHVKITAEDNTVTELTYGEHVTLFTNDYDDNNNLYYGVNFWKIDYPKTPKQVEYSEDGIKWTNIPRLEGHDGSFRLYNHVRTGAYRISASEHYSTIQANVYYPANTPLFSFMPSDDVRNSISRTDDLNAIEIDFGADGILNWSHIDANDIVLTDMDNQDTLTITHIQPVKNIDWTAEPFTASYSTRSMIIRTAGNMVSGHHYSLATSTSASADEIRVPNAGNYNLVLTIGTFYFSDYIPDSSLNTEVVIAKNAHYFDQVSIIKPQSPSSGGNFFFPNVPAGPKLGPGELETIPVREEIGGILTDTYKPDRKDVDQALKELSFENPKLTVHAKMDGDAVQVLLPADSLSEASSELAELIVTFDFGDQSYELPASALNLRDIARGLQADLADVVLKVLIIKQTGDADQSIRQTAETSGLKLLSDALEFTVIVEANGKQVEVSDFDNTYVSRSIVLNREVDKGKLTGVTFDPMKKEFRFVPAIVAVKDGKTVVTLKRTGNSIYAVVESNQSFSDIASHWAKNDIQLLASKLIVQGVSENIFAPERTVTRAEYTALLVRSLGLTPLIERKVTFDDVAAEDWYFGEVEAAVKAGLTRGDGTGNFNPNDQLTREQAAVLTAAALKFAGLPEPSEPSSIIFQDLDQINHWALQDIKILQSLQILSGMPDGNFEPQKTLTRAEAVTILKRLLYSAELMN